MLEGLNIRCNIGPFEILRSPSIVLTLARRAVVSVCEIEVPDPDGSFQAGLARKQPVRVRFGHRGAGGQWTDWQGTVRDFTARGDAMLVTAVGKEQALLDVRITEAMHNEPCDAVAKRVLEKSGLAIAGIEVPVETLPHIVFSNVTPARAIKQLSDSLTRSFGHDLSGHSVWLGEAGLYWSGGDEPGDVPVIETAHNLISCSPNPTGMSRVTATILPGFGQSRMVRIRDVRRGYSELVRAEEVIHRLGSKGNTTEIGYGVNTGWF